MIIMIKMIITVIIIIITKIITTARKLNTSLREYVQELKKNSKCVIALRIKGWRKKTAWSQWGFILKSRKGLD